MPELVGIHDVQKQYPDRTCCAMLEHLRACGFNYPFDKAIAMDNQTHKQSTPWIVRIGHMLSRGNLSMRDRTFIVIQFCPFCGAILDKKDEDDDLDQHD